MSDFAGFAFSKGISSNIKGSFTLEKMVFIAFIRRASDRQFSVSVYLNSALPAAFMYEKISAPLKLYIACLGSPIIKSMLSCGEKILLNISYWTGSVSWNSSTSAALYLFLMAFSSSFPPLLSRASLTVMRRSSKNCMFSTLFLSESSDFANLKNSTFKKTRYFSISVSSKAAFE